MNTIREQIEMILDKLTDNELIFVFEFLKRIFGMD